MIFLGSSLGALVVWALAGRIHPFMGVFFLSSLVRFTNCFSLLPLLREVRQVEAISYRSLFFRVSGVRAGLGPGVRFFLLPGTRPSKPSLHRGEETTAAEAPALDAVRPSFINAPGKPAGLPGSEDPPA